jgi:hypothetical protein
VSCTPPPLKSIVPLPLRQPFQGQPRLKASPPREPLAPMDTPTEPIGSIPSTTQDTAFAKIGARVPGTALASEALGGK